MKTKLLFYWDLLRTSFWFIPAVMVLGAVVLSFAAVELDRALGEEVQRKIDFRYTGGAEGARSVLSTIAGSMITVAGVVFSITIVALTLASSQFGPRLLRNFIRDRSNQAVLGTFVATFVYCLLVLRTVRGDGHDEFIPSISVVIGVAMALVGLGVLIYFIHHVATSIQAVRVIAAVSEELQDAIRRHFPEQLDEQNGQPDLGELPEWMKSQQPGCVATDCGGYIVAISQDSLMQIAKDNDITVRLKHRPGHFIVEGITIAEVWPAERVDEALVDKLNSTLELGRERTPFQDIEFGVDQLAEVAIRALSPGINDPFTAISCIDRLGESMCLLAGRVIPSPLRYDDEQKLRVVKYPDDFSAILDEAFFQIRQYGARSVAVMVRLLETLAQISKFVRRKDDLQALERHALLVLNTGLRETPDEFDKQVIETRYREFQEQVAKNANRSQ